MTRNLFFALAIQAPLLFGCGCDTLVKVATREHVPLSYVGMIHFGAPTLQDGEIAVPLTYSGGEWHNNSGLVACGVDAVAEEKDTGKGTGKNIDVSVLRAVANSKCKGKGYVLLLPRDTQGTYTVHYRDPDGTRHPVGTLKLDDVSD